MHQFTYLPKNNRDFKAGRHYIGASAVPTLFGLTKQYDQTPLTLWQELTGRRAPFGGNALTIDGHWHENGILAKWVHDHTDLDYLAFWISRLRGQTIFKDALHSFTEARHPDHEYAVAHADLMDLRDHAVLIQAKNTGFFAAKRGDDKNRGYDKDDRSQNGIPLGVYLQEQWEMFCYGVSTAYVVPQIDGHPGYLYGPITYHKPTVEKCLTLAERLWDCVKRDIPPRPESWPDVVRMFPELEEGTSTTITGADFDDAIAMRNELRAVNQKIKTLESRADDIKNATGLLIGGAQVLRGSDGSEIAKASERTSPAYLDLSQLRKDRPGLCQVLESRGYIKSGTSWRALNISGTSVGYGACKQCGSDAGEDKIIKKDGRKVSFGPFCRSCWGRIEKGIGGVKS